jgi:hypothetical protein
VRRIGLADPVDVPGPIAGAVEGRVNEVGAVVWRLATILQAGISPKVGPLIDRTEIYAFEEWWKRIEALIARADTVVFVLSPDAVASDVALREVSFAASLNKRFAPIVFVAASRRGTRTAQRLRRFVIASMFTLLAGIVVGLVG